MSALGYLPLPLAALLARVLAWVWWWVVPIRRRQAVQNLRQALPELPPGPTLRRSFQELVLGHIEVFHWARGRRLVRFEGWEVLADRCAAGEGTLFVGGHGGAYELALLSGRREAGVEASVFARNVENAFVARVVDRWRRLSGLEFLPPSGSMPDGHAALARGRLLVFAMDQ